MSAAELLRANDERFLALAQQLPVDAWSKASLCDRWSNNDVLAHLVVGYRATLRAMAAEMRRSAWSFDRGNAELARSLSRSRTTAELFGEFGELIDDPSGIGRWFPRQLLLGDHVTHELDIVLALECEPSIPLSALVAVLNTQVAVPNPFVPAYRNSRGLRLVATDAQWAHGTRGPLVEGRAAHLVSVLGNRPRMLAALQGDGVDLLASRVSPAPIRRAG